MRPYVQDADFTLYCGDVREVLRTLPSVGIELNEQYAELAARRLGQQSLLAKIA